MITPFTENKDRWDMSEQHGGSDRMKECPECGSRAQLYEVNFSGFRVACSATDCNLHGQPGTMDDWCDCHGPVCETVEAAIEAWEAADAAGEDHE